MTKRDEWLRTWAIALALAGGLTVGETVLAADALLGLEEPVEHGNYSGVANIRGWAVAQHGMNRVELYVDGVSQGNIPMGGSRQDVGNAHPGFPNAAHSGFSLALNYNELPAGEHTVMVRAFDMTGQSQEVSRTFNVQRFAVPFISMPDLVDLRGAKAVTVVDGNTINMRGVSVAGASYDVGLRWFTPAQEFAIDSISPHEPMFTCACDATGGCGNNAIGGAFNDLHQGLTQAEVASDYGPDLTGAQATGWVCLEERSYVCGCFADACGNDGVGGDHGDLKTGLTAVDVAQSFSPWRTDARSTGWQCATSQ
jgi:hypothetical protein